MPNVRLYGTDSNGNNILLRTVVCDKNCKCIEVIDHVPKEQLDEVGRKIAERAKAAFEDLAKQNPTGLLKVVSEQGA